VVEHEGIVSALAEAINKRGYEDLTPVQHSMLAPELRDADCLVSAQTGSGKTVAFGIAIAPTLLGGAERFAPVKSPLALVVAPTRELAMQVKRELEWLYEKAGASFASCVGGMDMRDERRALQRGAHIVIGTPGRLRDHIQRGSFDTTGLKAVVLDEADEMLDLGFREDLEFILDETPPDRRTLMFSATVPRTIESLAKRYQRNAVRVAQTSDQKQHLDIEYRGLVVAAKDSENAIVNVLRYFEAKNALVFCGTRATVTHITSRLNNRGFSVVALSGELSQGQRTHALQAMRDGRARVCVATDVAARGIDLPNLELVIHADIPRNKETLLHRSGRTGRAGRKGVCALIVPHSARKRTERLLGSANITATWAKPPSADEVIARDHERMLSDPILSEPLNDAETAIAQEILTRYSPEQVAAAFVRQRSAEHAAPEELLDVGLETRQRDTEPRERTPRPRDNFKDGVWLSLSVGREQSAEPRWLLPSLCRAGQITKREIGAIKVQANQTYVELTAESVDGFLTALGPGAMIEKSISVTRLDGSPPLQKDSRERHSEKPRRKKKIYTSDELKARDAIKPKRTFSDKSSQKPDVKPLKKRDEASKLKPVGKKPWDKTKAKSSIKPKVRKVTSAFAKLDEKGGRPKSAADAPLKRKKPKKVD